MASESLRPQLTHGSWRVSVVRPEDLLVLTLGFTGLKRSTKEGKAWLEFAAVPGHPQKSYIMLEFPAQSIAEEAFFQADPRFPVKGSSPHKDRDEKTGDDPPKANDIPVSTRLSGPSRLVFEVPRSHPPIEYSVAEVLAACRRLELCVASTALPAPRAGQLHVTPAWVSAVRAGTATPDVTLADVRARARVQRWEDNSELVPVVLSPPADEPVGADVSAPVRVLLDDVVDAVAGTGQPGSASGAPVLHEPTSTETAIEAPFRLIVSPTQAAAWVHATQPVRSERTGRCELWHTRLGVRLDPETGLVSEGDHWLRTIRAIWARSGNQPGKSVEFPDQQFGTDLTQRPGHSTNPFRMSLDAADRWDIVHLSANHGIMAGADRYVPMPVRADRLMLTPLGAWLDWQGRWEPPAGFEVEEWRHLATMARDHYVRVVYKGFLFPFGHRGSVIKVTERKFDPALQGNAAVLHQRMYLVVREPLVTYGDPALKTGEGHRYDYQLPFTSVRITTLVTPDLDDPMASDYEGKLQGLFWPKVGSQFFRFHLLAEDLEANRVEFTAPLVFVSNVAAFDEDVLESVRDDYESDARKQQHTVELHGQRLAMAESAEPGDTSFEADQLMLGAHVRDDAWGDDRPFFYPRVCRARVVVPALKGFTGSDGLATVTFAGDYLEKGLPRSGSPGTPGQVFLALESGPAMDFSSGGDRSGALVQPNFLLSGVSRLMGPVGGSLDNLAANTFSPADFFGAIKAKLFGVIELGEVLSAIGLDDPDLLPKFVTETLSAVESFLRTVEQLRARVTAAADAAQGEVTEFLELYQDVVDQIDLIAPAIDNILEAGTTGVSLTDVLCSLTGSLSAFRAKVGDAQVQMPGEVRKSVLAVLDRFIGDLGEVSTFVHRLEQALRIPDELRLSFEWTPKLDHWPVPGKADESIFLACNAKSGDSASLTVSAAIEAKTKLSPEPRFDVACRLHAFSINLFPGAAGFLRLHFNKLEFTAGTGAKADVNCEFDDVEFIGVLSFVQALRELIPLDGFSDPPALDVSEKGIAASYSLALPDIAFGVFSLENLSLGAGFTVPFLGDPLSVRFNFCERQSPFLLTVSMIGGGGFFGITIDPDGVQLLEASFEFGASLAINLGVASGAVHVMGGIYFAMQNDNANLTGYFRLGGEVDVLGLISVSIELYLGLTYEFSSGKCVGRATLTIEIEVVFFTIPVEISCERKLAGSDGDPTFAQLMAPGPDLDGDPWAEYCAAFA